jgi:hypothetical protein
VPRVAELWHSVGTDRQSVVVVERILRSLLLLWKAALIFRNAGISLNATEYSCSVLYSLLRRFLSVIVDYNCFFVVSIGCWLVIG